MLLLRPLPTILASTTSTDTASAGGRLLVQQRLLHVARLTSYNDDDFYRVDDYATQDEDNNNHHDDDHYVHYNSASGVDMSKYSLKYVGCQNVHVWKNSESAAQQQQNEDDGNDDGDDDENSNPLRLSRMVVLRLCEAQGCSNYNALGCQKNYADYLLPMDDYIDIMKEYHFEKLSKYCTVCADCLAYSAATSSTTTTNTTSTTTDDAAYQPNSNYYNNNDGAGGDRNLGNNNNNYYGYYNVDGSDDATSSNSNSYPWYIDQDGQCIFKTICRNYRSTCSSYAASLLTNDDGQTAMYTSCTAATTTTTTDTTTRYIGPHCAANGHTIELAVYADQYCSTFVQKADSTTVFGSSPYYSLEAYSSKKCLLCNAAQSYSLLPDDASDNNKNNAASTSSNPLCSALYDESAQCGQHMGSPYTYSKTTTTNVGYYDYNSGSDAETQVRRPCMYDRWMCCVVGLSRSFHGGGYDDETKTTTVFANTNTIIIIILFPWFSGGRVQPAGERGSGLHVY
jgi:hypothetical protein